jgi:hypothetical protein
VQIPPWNPVSPVAIAFSRDHVGWVVSRYKMLEPYPEKLFYEAQVTAPLPPSASSTSAAEVYRPWGALICAPCTIS